MKKNVALLVAGVSVLAGCSDDAEETKIVYVEKEPSQEAIEAAVKAELARMNAEGEELREVVRTLKNGDPSVHDAYYSYENGEKVLKVISRNPEDESSLSEYVVPVGAGILAGYTGARLADAILDSNRRYRDHCVRDIYGNLVGEGCYRGNPYHFGTGAYYQPRFPVIVYDDFSDYSTAKRRSERSYYNERVRRAPAERLSKAQDKPLETKVDHSKKTAAERSQAIRDKQAKLRLERAKAQREELAKSDKANRRPETGINKNTTGERRTPPMQPAKPYMGIKPALVHHNKPVMKNEVVKKKQEAKKPTTKQNAFNVPSRKSSSKWGNSSSRRSSGSKWGGGGRSRGFGG